jgi:hypothetical protein
MAGFGTYYIWTRVNLENHEGHSSIRERRRRHHGGLLNCDPVLHTAAGTSRAAEHHRPVLPAPPTAPSFTPRVCFWG